MKIRSFNFKLGFDFEINIKKNLWWWWPLSRSISFGRTSSPWRRIHHFGFFYLLTILPKSKAKLSCQWQFNNSTRQLSVSREKLSWAKLNLAKLRKSAQYWAKLNWVSHPKNVLQFIMGRIMCNRLKCWAESCAIIE